MPELKPCPCCGEEYIIVKHEDQPFSEYEIEDLTDEDLSAIFGWGEQPYVTCTDCGIRTSCCMTISDAIEQWNKRVGE